MKKNFYYYIPKNVAWFIAGAAAVAFIAAYVATNHTTQQIANFTLSQSPDSSNNVRLAPDNVVWFVEDSVKSTTDTLHLWRQLGLHKKQFQSRYKFTITTETSTIYVRVSGPGTDSVRVRAGEYFSTDYLHPLYDSTIYVIDSSSGTATYRIEFQGR